MSLLFISQPTFADENTLEHKIKAGYLYNFTKFVTWPADAVPTFNLCILGKDPFGKLIDPIEKKMVHERPIRLFRLNELKKGLFCHILFFSALPSISQQSFSSNLLTTLTVSEVRDFAAQGGMIGFIQKDGKIKLQINLDAAKQAGLKISAKLLEVAELIESSRHD
jgi:hypothetical protein